MVTLTVPAHCAAQINMMIRSTISFKNRRKVYPAWKTMQGGRGGGGCLSIVCNFTALVSTILQIRILCGRIRHPGSVYGFSAVCLPLCNKETYTWTCNHISTHRNGNAICYACYGTCLTRQTTFVVYLCFVN